ncbi:ATP-dependent RNA helicase SrmB [Caulifigura coniformis]|uniref:ATP-dependent RNA helicase SrmB n=2 Tax=Caulifigura coniformis TaxID=2527983 RepID=A0A517S9H4_9PLAN|nr:ATP-dependent RNA helicase SrmB [Caulifigura coniformis]
MSATKRQAAEIWESLFTFTEITPPRTAIAQFSAFLDFRIVDIEDVEVAAMAERVGLVVTDTLRKIRHNVTREFLVEPGLDPASLSRQGSQIAVGKRQHLDFAGASGMPQRVPVNRALRSLLGRLMKAFAERLFLFEGRLAHVACQVYERIATSDDGTRLRVESVRSVEYSTAAVDTAKVRWIVSRLEHGRHVRTIVMVRNTDVGAYLSARCAAAGVACVRLWGEMGDSERRNAIARLRNGSVRVAIVNRNMGGRGFDLPFIDEAIFVSPKSSHEAMWQEALRIRSTRKRVKPAFVLVFRRTEESDKCARLLQSIEANPKEFSAKVTKVSAEGSE